MKENSRIQKKNNTEKILLNLGAKLLRQKGIKQLSINEVMATAKLTRGSFYVYFKNKKDMVLKCFKHSINEANEKVKVTLDAKNTESKSLLNDFLDFYLSPFHRDKVGEGCPIAALSREFSQEDSKLRYEFSNLLSKQFEQRRQLLTHEGKIIPREEWIGITSSYIGGIILSRACKGEPLSEEILKATKEFIIKQERG